jgi:hypothetical protein
MKKLNLQDYDVRELSSDEAMFTLGGGWWSDFKCGFLDGFQWMREFVKDVFGGKVKK